jgi:hypothetical protein
VTYRGHIQNGQIVLDEPTELPDGAAVAVQVLESRPQPRGSAGAIIGALESWEGPPGELDRLLMEVQEMRAMGEA